MRVMHFISVCVTALVAWDYLPGEALLTAAAGNPANSSLPALAITEVPPLGEGGPDQTFSISGTARGIDPAKYKVVVYAFAGGRWWVQPLTDAPLTDIGANGTWQTETHRGFQYAALLVRETYEPKATVSTLPTVGGDVVAMDRKPIPTEQQRVADDESASRLPIVITGVPPVDKGGPNRTFPIEGRVNVANSEDYKVVIYAYAGGTWWVQPLADAPLTDIGKDNRWQTETHGGSQYAALLVKRTCRPGATMRTLPQAGGDVVAIDRKPDGTSVAIAITMVPLSGVGSDTTLYRIEGTVSGVGPADYKVVIYAYAGGIWWVQPLENAPLTDIGEDRRWHAETHPGLQYGALLVKRTYQPRATLSVLPKVGEDVVAMDLRPLDSERPQPQPNTRPEPKIIRFSGYDWMVKTGGDRRVGPGQNYFSEDAVFVDDEGLHLRVFSRDGKHFCGEIISKRSLGYGSYHFFVASNVDDLDRNLVLGMFTWSDDPAYSHREIDIEISSWGKAGNDNAQYVIQPYSRKDNVFRFVIPQGLKESSHSFLWTKESVLFQGDGLKKSAGQAEGRVVFPTHTFTMGIPQAGNENVRINLWLVNGRPAGEGKKEILIREFRFEPLP